MIDPLITMTISLALGVLLLGAAWHKASAFTTFRAILGDYQLVPGFLVPTAAILVTLLESSLAIAWLAGMARPIVAVATAALFTVYAVAMAINLTRGRVHISCGCGFGRSRAEDEPLSWWLVLRNVLLIAAALTALAPPSARELGALDWLTVMAALVASTLLYLGASQLLKNGSAIRSWRRPRD